MTCLQLNLPSFFFFFNDTATTEIYTLSLHDALPILDRDAAVRILDTAAQMAATQSREIKKLPTLRGRTVVNLFFEDSTRDRKSTRLNSSHANISYAVFCLKKKNTGGYDIISSFSVRG